MRTIKHKGSSKKLLVLGVAVVALIAAGAGGYYLYAKNQNKQPASNTSSSSSSDKANGVNYSPPTQAQQDAGYDAKKAALDSEPPAPTSSNNPPLTITSAAQNGDTLSIRIMIQTTEANGTCSLEMTKSGSDAVTQQASTESLGSYYVCQGFDIPTAGLAKGDWTATITYKKDSETSTANKTVTIN